jgi:hypothetical protein
MLSSFPQCILLFSLATNFLGVSGVMVESIDGSFVPWSFVARASGNDGLAVRLINNNDLSYLVSSHFPVYFLSSNQVIGNCADGLVLVARTMFSSHSVIMSCDRESSSANPNGRFAIAEPHLSGVFSSRRQRCDVVCIIVDLVAHSLKHVDVAITQTSQQVTS